MKKKHFILIIIAPIILIVIIILGIQGIKNDGTEWIKQGIEKFYQDKEKCILNEDDITKLQYKNQEYTITNQTVSKYDLGNWVGYIRKIVDIDKNGNLIKETNDSDSNIETTTISFGNVYLDKKTQSSLIIAINSNYYIAIKTNEITDNDSIFDYKKVINNANTNFELDSEDVSKIISNNNIYEITNQQITNDIGEYIGIIAKKIFYDAKTMKQLSKKELLEIDWTGKNSSKREVKQAVYTDIRKINNMDINETIAVCINNKYYVASRIK